MESPVIIPPPPPQTTVIGGKAYDLEKVGESFKEFTYPSSSLLDEAIESCVEGIHTRCQPNEGSQFVVDENKARSVCLDAIKSSLKGIEGRRLFQNLDPGEYFWYAQIFGSRTALKALGKVLGSSKIATMKCNELSTRKEEAGEKVTGPEADDSLKRTLLIVGGVVLVAGGIAALFFPGTQLPGAGAIKAGAAAFASGAALLVVSPSDGNLKNETL